MLILYSTIIVPVRVCFPNAEAAGATWVREASMSCCFSVDCLFSFRLGHQLALFQRAANTLYFQSVKGKAPAWLAAYLDGRCPGLREELRGVWADEGGDAR